MKLKVLLLCCLFVLVFLRFLIVLHRKYSFSLGFVYFSIEDIGFPGFFIGFLLGGSQEVYSSDGEYKQKFSVELLVYFLTDLIHL